jgi:hypothetical protein
MERTPHELPPSKQKPWRRVVIQVSAAVALATQAVFGATPEKRTPPRIEPTISPLNELSCDLHNGFDLRGAVKFDETTHELLRCDGKIWKKVPAGPKVGEYDPLAQGIRLREWPDNMEAKFSHWASPPQYNATMRRWERIGCYVGGGGMGCDMVYEVPNPGYIKK